MGEYRVLVSQVILDEWDRNLETTKKKVIERIKNQYATAMKISKHLEEPQKSNFKTILSDYKSKELLRIDSVKSTIGTIDKVIKSKSTNIPISQKVKDKVLEYGLLKKAPFKSKNSTGDALIFFSAMEYLETQSSPDVSDSIFISYNSDDFSKSKKELDEIHPDLKKYIDSTKTKYERNIAIALKLSKEMQNQINDYLDYRAESELQDDYIQANIDRHMDMR